MAKKLFSIKRTAFSTEEIVQNITHKSNYEKTIQFIYEDNFEGIKSLILSMGGNEFDAEDIFQDAIAKLIWSIEKSKFKGSAKISTYIYTICKNMWINTQKKEYRYKLVDAQQDSYLFDESLTDETPLKEDSLNAKKQFSEALKEIGADCQSIFKSFYYEGKTFNEILSFFNGKYSTEQAIRNKKSRCLKYLRQKLEERNISSEALNNILDSSL
ncbi:RNA polymerase sigma factor [Sediminitomix flava]|uniref:RNA polymerase sigma factor (Sigma-70 family) n=1 Tax=Sediminitomix flava TaxID=379075 RepID=A0A315Z7J5_SEDFL|nr:sigma-70 family RNA polymerase sigma factor [Sediminitomix flava]PWJ40827.1 RNA polymerase sigma factor (sigma-70 family) [Sediminitomix flava]